jgi:hypothetical protein
MKQFLVIAKKDSDILLFGSKITTKGDLLCVHDSSGKEEIIMTIKADMVDYIEAMDDRIEELDNKKKHKTVDRKISVTICWTCPKCGAPLITECKIQYEFAHDPETSVKLNCPGPCNSSHIVKLDDTSIISLVTYNDPCPGCGGVDRCTCGYAVYETQFDHYSDRW